MAQVAAWGCGGGGGGGVRLYVCVCMLLFGEASLLHSTSGLNR